MRVVSAGEIDRALAFPTLVDALRTAFVADIVAPTRHHHSIARPGADATLLLMPAWTGAAAPVPFAGVKVVTVYPDNAQRGLASVLGTYLLLDGATGQPLAALDGTRLTLWRTAAASALAAGYLARPDSTTLVMAGAGALAPFLIRAHLSQRPIRRVLLWNHRHEKASALAAGLAAEGLPVEHAPDLEPAVREADIVSCATLASEPFLRGEWLKPGAHLDLVGAFNRSMREADDAALRRASLFVDTQAALTEGGDVTLGLASGAIRETDIRAKLAQLCAGQHAGRMDASEITLFKSVGAALEDLAAAMLVWQRLA